MTQLRNRNYSYVEIAKIISTEDGEYVSDKTVRRDYLNHIRRIENLDDMARGELSKLEEVAAGLKKRIDWYEQQAEVNGALPDDEVYAKITDQWLKYRDRIAKLYGLDKGGINGRVNALPKDAYGRDVLPSAGQPANVTIIMPGSVEAFERWNRLQEVGAASLATEVLELAEADTVEIMPGSVDVELSGVTLRPDIEVIPGAEIRSSLDALKSFAERDAEEDEVA